MNDFYKELKKGFGIIAMISIVSGMLLLFYPQATSKMACYLLGSIIFLQGLLSLINALKAIKTSLGGKFLFVWSLILMGIGIFFIIRTNVIISIIPLIFGLFILASGVVDVAKAMQLKALDYTNWLITLIMAILKCILGVVMIFNLFRAAVTMLIFLGLCLVYAGVSSMSIIYGLSKCRDTELSSEIS